MGDTVGHAFHGNQWGGGGGTEQRLLGTPMGMRTGRTDNRPATPTETQLHDHATGLSSHAEHLANYMQQGQSDPVVVELQTAAGQVRAAATLATTDRANADHYLHSASNLTRDAAYLTSRHPDLGPTTRTNESIRMGYRADALDRARTQLGAAKWLDAWLELKGDSVGHPFRGNQHTGGQGGADAARSERAARWAAMTPAQRSASTASYKPPFEQVAAQIRGEDTHAYRLSGAFRSDVNEADKHIMEARRFGTDLVQHTTPRGSAWAADSLHHLSMAQGRYQEDQRSHLHDAKESARRAEPANERGQAAQTALLDRINASLSSIKGELAWAGEVKSWADTWAELKYTEGQPRDERGRFGSGGGGNILDRAVNWLDNKPKPSSLQGVYPIPGDRVHVQEGNYRNVGMHGGEVEHVASGHGNVEATKPPEHSLSTTGRGGVSIVAIGDRGSFEIPHEKLTVTGRRS